MTVPPPQLATNAPPLWPRIVGPLEPRGDDAARMRNITKVADALHASGKAGQVVGIDQWTFVPGGLVLVPIVLRVGGKPGAVFVYGDTDEQAGAHYAGARRALAAAGQPTAYYATRPLPQAEPHDIVTPFEFTLVSRSREEPVGIHSMWWSTPEDPLWAQSKVRAAFRRLHLAAESRWSYIVAGVLAETGVVEEGTMRVTLDDFDYLHLSGPEGSRFIVSFDQEKGLRLHFAQSTPHDLRDRIWHAVADWAERLTGLLTAHAHRFPLDKDSAPTSWSRVFDQEVCAAGAKTVAVGRLDAGPSSAP